MCFIITFKTYVTHQQNKVEHEVTAITVSGCTCRGSVTVAAVSVTSQPSVFYATENWGKGNKRAVVFVVRVRNK